jgi:hypothetical protein
MCAKCKLQLGQHLADNQGQNYAQTSSNIHQQCHHFNNQDTNSCEISDKDDFPFQEFNSKELINIQNAMREKYNLINAKNEQSVTNNLNLINTDNEINLINETLREPLLHIANKLLGRQNLSFDQLTPPEQKLRNLFENSDINEFLTGEKDTIPEIRHNWITCSAKPKVTLTIKASSTGGWPSINNHCFNLSQLHHYKFQSLNHHLFITTYVTDETESTTGLSILDKKYARSHKNSTQTFSKQLNKSNQNAK